MEKIQKVAAIVLRSRKILAVKEDLGDIFITLGGRIEDGETHEQCLRRELKEELGITLMSADYFGTYEGMAVYQKVPMTIFAYMTQVAGDMKPGNEIKEFRWLNSKDNTELGMCLKDFIMPKLLKMGLID